MASTKQTDLVIIISLSLMGILSEHHAMGEALDLIQSALVIIGR